MVKLGEVWSTECMRKLEYARPRLMDQAKNSTLLKAISDISKGKHAEHY